jgi:hypothetical protein
MNLTDELKKLSEVNLFEVGRSEESFVGDPFYLDYEIGKILVCDAWKQKVKGIPQGTFLLAFYENEENIKEAILLRALKPTPMPTDSDLVKSMLEYYKDNEASDGNNSQLDPHTRYEFSFSGLECRVLGTFYEDLNGKTIFGADIENFYSPHHYKVYKPMGSVLKKIVNYREVHDDFAMKLGKVRYSSTSRFQQETDEVPFIIDPEDFLGKRTALFGMTRTGKSNSVKIIISSAVESSLKAKSILTTSQTTTDMSPIDKDSGGPKYPVGQIIFDINGEYANANMQDEGTAIFELHRDKTIRYSVMEKEGFKIMKVNFYSQLQEGFALIQNYFQEQHDRSDYVNSFLAINLEKPDDAEDKSAQVRYERKIAAYKCVLHKAGFSIPDSSKKVTFSGNAEINSSVRQEGLIDPSKGITLQEACIWFEAIWKNYHEWDFFQDYRKKKGKDWADEELQAILGMLTRHKQPGQGALVSGYLKLQPLKKLHTSSSDASFEVDIVDYLRRGLIVIVDLSQGDPDVQKMYAVKICRRIFTDSMERFINYQPNNFIQMYFEEAHNLFPRKEDKDLSQIYNRLAKEGAKLNLGLIYATQEVSSLSSNILKNTQNWFVAHLNNQDELKELTKYYDFTDFAETLTHFSSDIDKGFVRVKTYSNPFVVPVQIDRFLANNKTQL